jgi:hypothetical protein
MAAWVSAFGTFSSNGTAWSLATRVSVMRTTSEIVRPKSAKTAEASSFSLSSILGRTKAVEDMLRSGSVAHTSNTLEYDVAHLSFDFKIDCGTFMPPTEMRAAIRISNP